MNKAAIRISSFLLPVSQQILESGKRTITFLHPLFGKGWNWHNPIPRPRRKPRLRRPMPAPATVKDDLPYLRSQTLVKNQVPYTPPAGPSQISAIVEEIALRYADDLWNCLGDRQLKFKILSTCVKHFNHDIPNCLLNEMNSLDDVVAHFATAVDDKKPIADIASLDLPPNLYIQEDYIRFGDNDRLFKQTAYPGRDTMIAGWRQRQTGKFKGYRAPRDPFDKNRVM